MRVAILGDPTKAMGSITEAECRRIIGAIDLAASEACRSSGSRCRPAPRSRWTRAARTSTGSPGCCAGWSCTPKRGRRGQHRRRRHQRRRPAVLERRVDDADAHVGDPRDDPRQRDGAHRQAGDRLLGRGVGRGQPRHRRLQPHHGPERRGAVLRAHDGGRLPAAHRPLRPHVPGARRALAPAGRHRRPPRPRRPPGGPRGRRDRLRHRRRHLLRRRPTATARSRSTSAR